MSLTSRGKREFGDSNLIQDEERYESHPVKDDQKYTRASVEDSLSMKAFAQLDNGHVSRISKLRLFFGTLAGALLGMILSIVVNSVLFEISVNRLFAFYFGIIFCVLGSLILMRAWTQPTVLRKLGVLALSAVVIGGGACSLVFRTEWLWWSSVAKVFIYTLLGVATSFTITFSWVDIVSFIHDIAKRSQNTKMAIKYGLIESQAQIWLLVVISVITGLTYGLIFGLVQMEEMTVQHHSRQRLMNSLGRTELFSLPFGAAIGATGAFFNECIRHHTMLNAMRKEVEYKPLNQTDLDGV